MTKKIICLLLAISMMFIVCSCDNGNDQSDVSDDKQNGDVGIAFTIGKETFKADLINTEPTGDKISVYTHDYADDDGYIMSLDRDFNDYAVISVRYFIRSDGKQESYLYKVDMTNESKKGMMIPYNGFIAVIPMAKLEGLRVKENMITEISGFEGTVKFDRTDLATVSPTDRTLTRRITYIDPYKSMPEGEQIVFITEDYVLETLPADSVALILKNPTSTSYKVAEIRTDKGIAEGECAIIFSGKYNKVFATSAFAVDDRITVQNTNSLSSYTSVPAVVAGEGDNIVVYKSDSESANTVTDIANGIFVYEPKFGSQITPAREGEFVDVVVVNGIVAYIGEVGERVLMPTDGGFVISFNGTSKDKAGDFKIGQNVSAELINTEGIGDNYVRYNDDAIGVEYVNVTRSTEGMIIIYTSAFGKSTLTNQYGTEITVVDGKITAIGRGEGDAPIPEDGYVISIHKDNTAVSVFGDANVGDSIDIVLSRSTYSAAELNVDGYNTVRNTDMLIVYDKGKSTNTNQYGYELCVSADGTIIGEGIGGNSSIPEGGFVLSGHGASADALKALYCVGADVILDKTAGTVKVISNPLLICDSATILLESVKADFEDAQKRFYDVDYKKATEMFDRIENLIEQSATAKSEGRISDTINFAADACDLLEEITYVTIVSKPVENRAAWYRSTDKSDDEVRTTLEKAKMLGLNALYIETWYNGEVLGYSSIVGHHDDLNGDYDALEGFCRIAKEYGIEIHAWVEDFFIGTVSQSQSDPDALINKIPTEQILLDREGRNYNQVQDGQFVFLNPYNRECRDFVLSVYKEIITKYDVAGLHLDYIRFPEWNYGTSDYGYNEDTMEAFKQESGYKGNVKALTSGTYYNQWVEFRQNIINSFVKEVYEMVMQTRPDVWISCAAYPGIPDVKNTIYQDVDNWVKNGWIDEVFSMTYSESNDYVGENASKFVNLVGTDSFYSVGLSAFGETPSDIFAQQFDVVRKAGADGSAMFSLASVNSESWLKTSDKYAYGLINGPHSSSSIQANRLNETLAAQIEYFEQKKTSLYGDAYVYGDVIDSVLAELKQEAQAFDLQNSTLEQKKAYAENAYGKLDDLYKAYTSTQFDGDDTYCRIQVKKDIDEMRTTMARILSRINARCK